MNNNPTFVVHADTYTCMMFTSTDKSQTLPHNNFQLLSVSLNLILGGEIPKYFKIYRCSDLNNCGEESYVIKGNIICISNVKLYL